MKDIHIFNEYINYYSILLNFTTNYRIGYIIGYLSTNFFELLVYKYIKSILVYNSVIKISETYILNCIIKYTQG